MTAPLSRERIVQTARRLVDTDEEPLSIRRVARELGVTAPALYAYVENRRDLLAGVAEDHFDRLRVRFEAVDEPDPLVRMRLFAHDYVDHARSSPGLFRLLFRFPPIDMPGSRAFEASTRVFELATTAIRDALDARLLEPADPLDIATTVWCAMHGVAEVVLMGFVSEDRIDGLVDRVTDTTLIGLGAPVARVRTDPTDPSPTA